MLFATGNSIGLEGRSIISSAIKHRCLNIKIGTESEQDIERILKSHLSRDNMNYNLMAQDYILLCHQDKNVNLRSYLKCIASHFEFFKNTYPSDIADNENVINQALDTSNKMVMIAFNKFKASLKNVFLLKITTIITELETEIRQNEYQSIPASIIQNVKYRMNELYRMALKKEYSFTQAESTKMDLAIDSLEHAFQGIHNIPDVAAHLRFYKGLIIGGEGEPEKNYMLSM